MNKIYRKITQQLTRRHLSLAVCESCTGGMLGSMITSVPGSSRFFKGGIIAYSNTVKETVAGVSHETLKRYGAVSANTAIEMAGSVWKRTKSDIGVGITGIAGPGGGTRKKPVGLVFIAVVDKKGVLLDRCLFTGTRDVIRRKSCHRALRMIGKILQSK